MTIVSKGVFQTSFFVCLIAIEYLATTTVSIPAMENSWDKFNHFFAFFVLYVLLSLAYWHFGTIKKIVLLLLFALQIEIVQYFIPNRYFSLLDIFADLIGIVAGIIFVYYFLKIIKPQGFKL